MEKQGKIKISSENMMPIIKKWLYSDKDIFLREIVANGMDAITKYKKLVDMGEVKSDEEEYHINIYIDKDARTLSVEDNGIGMTAEEVEKYITQVAFSGAEDFLQKYENTSGDGIIGHFGLGFYSAYMVSERVEIYTKSYKEEPAVRWESDGNSRYTLSDTEKIERGTKIVMHIAEGEEEFLEESRIRTLLQKYCSFMPYSIYLMPKGEKDTPINNTAPLYLKDPKECTEEEYKSFYRDTFMDYNEPLFWIHLNMDYPFRLKGILYFPQVPKNQVQLEKGEVKLYCNQVFIADNIKEVIPEFLMLLNGVIDCPDIPLNVSRSFLQNDKQVQKISKHITKKVADKLISIYNNDLERYQNCWKDIATFIKFGCIREEDFYEKVQKIILYKNLNGEFATLESYFGEEISEEDLQKGVQSKTIYYVSDEKQQAQYIAMFKDAGLDAIMCDTYMDPHFISFIEYKNYKKCHFARIDSNLDAALKVGDSDAAINNEEIVAIFKKYLTNQDIQIETTYLKSGKVSALINVDEFARRMSEIKGAYATEIDEVMKGARLMLNLTNPIVSSIVGLSEEKQKVAVNYIYYLAMLAFKPLSPKELADFMQQSNELLFLYTK